jgi:hypothetical protein
MLYESGSSIGSFGGAGVGASRAGLSGSLFGGTTKNQTLLAQRVAPPPRPRNVPDYSGATVIWASVLFLIAACVFLAIHWLLPTIFAGGVGIIFLTMSMGAKSALEMDRHRQERMERWRNSWLCLRCGQEFVESSDGAVICESIDSKTKQIRDTEGVIPAIKFYREQSSVGLAEAKDYVERL